jgi:hypothetical protein
MSTAVSRTLPLGPVIGTWGGIRLGSPKTQAAIKYTRETVEYGLEDQGVQVGSHPTKEIVQIDIAVADFKASQYRYALGQGKSMQSSTTIGTSGYTATVQFLHNWREEIRMSGTTSYTVQKAGWLTGTIKVYKSDYSNAPAGFTRGTDWTGTGSNGHIKRKTGGTIISGTTVIVEYAKSATSAVVYAGGNMIGFEAALRLTCIDDTGKALTIYCPRAKRKGASDFAIQMAAEFGGVAMSFVCLADMTLAPSKQIIQIGVQA